MREEESLSLWNVAAGRLLMAPADDQTPMGKWETPTVLK